MCYFYVLYSKHLDSYYVGHTCDALSKRLRRHNTGHKGFTGRANDWNLVYSEEFAKKEEAYFRERRVKKWKSRLLLKKLVKSNE